MRAPLLVLAAVAAASAAAGARGQDEPFDVLRSRFDAAARTGEVGTCRGLALLTSAGHAEGVTAVAAALHDRRTPAVWAHATDAFSRVSSPEALARLRTVAETASIAERTSAVLSLGAKDDPAARGILARALMDRHPAVRASAILALSTVDRGPAGGIAVVEALTDASWQVRAAAVRAAATRRVEAAVPVLIRFLEMERTRLAADAEAALRLITGQDLGREPGPWERWLATRQAPPRGDIEYDLPTWYGVPVVGERPVFVLDVSGSMDRPVTVSPADRKRLAATAEFGTKLDLAREELVAVLGRLPRTSRFGVVVYSDEAKAWRSGLIPASPDNVRSAGAVVARAGSGGLTNIYDALLLAMDPTGRDDFFERGQEAPDQVLFLTDGVPSTGLFRDEATIRRVVSAVASLRGVRIDCVAIATGQTAFLRGLADDTGGVCVSVGR